MTNRQKVRSVYPNAELWNGYDVSYRALSWIGEYNRIWLSVDKDNAYDAWKDAWKTVQYLMLKKLEQ